MKTSVYGSVNKSTVLKEPAKLPQAKLVKVCSTELEKEKSYMSTSGALNIYSFGFPIAVSGWLMCTTLI